MSPADRAIVLALVLAVAAGSGPAYAALRCGNHLVNEGDTAGELAARCGPPTDVDRRTVLRPAIIWRAGRPIQVPGGDIEVSLEIWTYNFGPNKLMRQIRVEDGRVRTIETLGYGYW
jgi:hypothetical protein